MIREAERTLFRPVHFAFQPVLASIRYVRIRRWERRRRPLDTRKAAIGFGGPFSSACFWLGRAPALGGPGVAAYTAPFINFLRQLLRRGYIAFLCPCEPSRWRPGVRYAMVICRVDHPLQEAAVLGCRWLPP